MNRCVGYVRVSTEQQVKEGESLDAQEARIRAWAAANNYEVAAVHRDAGLSAGRADNRPGLQKALLDAKDGTALVVYSLSRLARSTRDAIAIADRLEKAKADLVSLTERIDTTTAAGKMTFRLLSVLNEFERDLAAERTRMVMAHLRLKGQRIGRIPFGWDLGPDGHTLQRNPKEQTVIKAMQRRRAAGKTYDMIAQALERLGHRTKAGAKRWHGKVVRAVLMAAKRNAQLGLVGR